MNEATPMDTLAASTGPLLGEGRLLATGGEWTRPQNKRG